MKKRFIAFSSAGLMIFALAACSTNTPTTSSPSPSTSASASPAVGTPIIGQVTAISDDTITLALGTQDMPQGGGPGGDSGEMPSPGAEAPSAMPDNNGQQPEGKDGAPDGGQPRGGQMGLTLTGETKTISVSSDTVITVSGNGKETVGTLSDIAVDAILTVTMSGDTVTAISVSTFSPTAPLGDEASNATDRAAQVSANNAASA